MLKYCSKGDDYVSNMDVDKALEKEPTRKLIARKLLTRSLKDVYDEHPELIYDYKKIKLNLAEV